MTSCRTIRKSTMNTMTTKEHGQIPGPSAKFSGRYTTRVILWIIENTKHVVSQVFRNWACHAGEPTHEEVDRVPAVLVE